eukprot:CAMPEP_0194532662 /NCGR_PEP_ID=MMETSP0253-20130528/70284_1 /TAXON_ID=2966 /ORGANISM="Noctiluca scintillans" /LENGTH=428 /DNA_ID=CAMNT_0039378133 /DNA_START=118 /DNA_END=1405 /DNA_ORIENTATION=-
MAGETISSDTFAAARVLEQRELSQMRHHAILQRRLDATQEECRKLRQQHEQRRLQQSSEVSRRSQEEVSLLQVGLSKRLAESESRANALEHEVSEERARYVDLQNSISLWRDCAQKLVRLDQDANHATEPVVSHPEVSVRAAQFHAQCQEVAAETEVLRRSCGDFKDQFIEIEKLAVTARAQDDRLRRSNAELEKAIDRVEACALHTQREVASLKRRQEEVVAQTDVLRQRTDGEMRAMSFAGEVSCVEEVTYLRRKVQDNRHNVDDLMRERGRLNAALIRHTPDTAPGAVPGLDDDRGCWGALDTQVSRMVTLLFKSVFARRLFCVHMLILYNWLVFVLWWMATIDEAPQVSDEVTCHTTSFPGFGTTGRTSCIYLEWLHVSGSQRVGGFHVYLNAALITEAQTFSWVLPNMFTLVSDAPELNYAGL